LIIHAIPAQKIPSFILEHKEVIPSHVLYFSTSKGLFLGDWYENEVKERLICDMG